MAKVLFTIRPHSIIDVITNSSTELFVGKSNSKEELIELIEEVHPNFRNEYEEIKHIDEVDPSELESYFCYMCSPHQWPASKRMYSVLPGFTFDELYEPEDNGTPAWNGEVQYKLKNNVANPKNKWDRDFVTEANIEEIKNKLDPERKMYFMFSIEDNPEWDYQEKLSEFMTRIHLG